MLKTRFTAAYGLDAPIACAGMAFASMTPALPAAVSAAGAMGSLANVGHFAPALLEQLMGGIRALTPRPFSVNFITPFVQDAVIEVCARLRPASVSFHWGRPEPRWVNTLHAADVKVWQQVGNAADAKRAFADGIDLIIVQGSEAGGHNFGATSTLTLVPAVRDAVGADGLLLAAGGIVDGRGLAAALALGADGAWVGTRFVATHESDVHAEWKARLVAAEGSQTVCTHVFGRHHPDFNPMRVLCNRVVAEWNEKVDAIPVDNSKERVVGTMEVWGQPQQLRRFQNLAPMASAAGDFEELPLLAGEGVSGIHEILSAQEVVMRMSSEAQAILQRLGGASQ